MSDLRSAGSIEPGSAPVAEGGSPTLHGTAIRLRGITKTYPGVVANDGVDLDVASGTVHGLLGENGAGKSTLMKVLFGLIEPDAGSIEIDGEVRDFRSPADALAAGVGMVQQHFSLVNDFTVTENLVLGDEPRRGRVFLDREWARRDIQALADRYGFRLDAGKRVGEMAVGARQRVEILKALYRGARILILDEPTAALAPQEVDELFAVLRQLVAGGCTVVFISHKLPEVIAMCDAVTVLRDGSVVGTQELHDHERPPGPARTQLEEQLARLMVGRPLPALPPRATRTASQVELVLEGVTDGDRVGPLDIQVQRGEILGVAGVEGNGQTELVELLVGVRRCRTGRIELSGQDITRWSARQRLAAGLAHVAEDRHAAAVAAEMTVADNSVLGYEGSPPFSKRGWRLSPHAIDHFARSLLSDFHVRAPSIRAKVAQLSGGNQQKLVVGRELSRRPTLMIAAQPTRGLDIAATAFVHEQLVALRDAGAAVLLVSLDLSEVLTVSDRVVVMYSGRIAGEGRPGDLQPAQLGAWMVGKEDER